ncbi:MAG: SDR family NAD(P)-dependent oxidoreductase [Myxococcota bacterium]|nr:SDR family NAD(P)-dependent oxidoreductase [Myxococcota bacterium]
MQEFNDHVAVITGSASGIGRGIAQVAAGEGMRLVLADVDDEGVESLAEELRRAGTEVCTVHTDVREAEAVDALARQALETFGAVHLLCNNAGVLVGGNAWERTDDDWRWVMDVNLFGVVNGLRSFVPIFLDQGGPAHIVNTSSLGGLMVGPYLSPYIVSKHAVVALSESVFHELAGLNASVGVSVLCPGPIATGITRSERIRPPDRSETRGLSSPAERAFSEMLNAGVEAGMAPEEVGRIVFEAIKANQFWIHTHPLQADSIRDRAEQIIEARNPAYSAEFSSEILDGD